MKTKIEIPKIIRGCWQLSEDHSAHANSIAPIIDAVNAGFITFDCADIYLGVESLLGQASQQLPADTLRMHTKFVPDKSRLADINFEYIESVIDRSLQRLNVEQLHLVQFHWWDFEIKNYMFALDALSDLKAKGKIAHIGLTNVNLDYLKELSAQHEIFSVQSQVSLFDDRINRGILHFCRQHDIKVFGYGALLGGFLSTKWLNQNEPTLESLGNRSLVKYKLLIDDACTWQTYQERLLLLDNLAQKYHCGIANVVIAALLQSHHADAIIAGLSAENYAAQNQQLSTLPELTNEDLKMLTGWHSNLQGDAYDLERDKNGTHAKIMKYDLNAAPTAS